MNADFLSHVPEWIARLKSDKILLTEALELKENFLLEKHRSRNIPPRTLCLTDAQENGLKVILDARNKRASQPFRYLEPRTTSRQTLTEDVTLDELVSCALDFFITAVVVEEFNATI